MQSSHTSAVILRPLTAADRPDYDALYKEAFPAAERKSMDSMLTGEFADAYDVLVISTPDRSVAGMVITVTHGDLVMLDYLAIHPAMRGQGLGHMVLPLAKERFPGKHFFLEIETPSENCANPVQRIRRKAFYLSTGMVETHVHAFIYSTDMELLAYPEDVPAITFDGYAALIDAYFPPEMRAQLI